MQNLLFQKSEINPRVLSCKNFEQETDEEFAKKLQKANHVANTDDCYTPTEVYAEVLAWVRKKWNLPAGTPIVRPFFPGGDYKKIIYPDRGVVVDNPPFSIVSQIAQFYDEVGIRFFLFSPALSLFNVKNGNFTYVIPKVGNLTFHNGKRVNCAFVTNLTSESRIILAPTLLAPKAKADASEGKTNINAARLLKFVRRLETDFEIKKADCTKIGKGSLRLFGGSKLVNSAVIRELEEKL